MQFLQTILLALSATTTFAAVIDTSKLQPAAPVPDIAGTRGTTGIAGTRGSTGITQNGPKQGGVTAKPWLGGFIKGSRQMSCNLDGTFIVQGEKGPVDCQLHTKCIRGGRIEWKDERSATTSDRMWMFKACNDTCGCS